MFLLAHGTADIICLPERKTCQLPKDLHDLFLIDDAAIGHIQNVGQLRGLIADFVRFMAVAQVGRDGIHRAGAVQADQSDDIFQILRLQAHQHLLHTRRFKLEHAFGLTPGEHFVGFGIVIIQLGDGEIRFFFLDGQLRIPDDRQGAQTEEVHLQQTQLLDLRHVELGHRQAIVGGKGQIIIRWFRGNHNTGCMGRSVAGHSLHLHGSVEQFRHLRVRFIHPPELRRDLQRMFDGHFELRRDLLCHYIHFLIRHSHHTAHIADCIAGSHGAKGNDLGYMVSAILAVDVVDHFLAAFVAEVHVEIGHTDTFRVQKALKDQVIADGVNVSDAHAVCCDTARTGATARAHRDPLALGIVDVIPDDEVIVGIAHRLDDADLVVQAVFVGLRHIGTIAALQTFPAELFKEHLVVHAAGGLIIRNFGVTKLKIKIALVGNDLCVGTGIRHHGKQIVHLIRCFNVEFVGLELHTVGILHGFSGLDAEQDRLHLGILLAQVVGVVGGCHGDAGLPCQLDELGQHDVILFQPVILQFNVVIALTKEVAIPQGRSLSALVIAGQDRLRNLTRQAGREADETFVVLLQQLLIHTRLGVEALDKGGRDQLGKVFIACLVLAQQDQMIVPIDLVHLIKAGAGGYIDLTADDWLDARLFGRLVKLHTAVHHTVVGAGNGSLATLLHPIHQLVNAAGTIQQTVFCMDMEVDEVSSLLIALTGFDHFVSSFSAFSSNLLRRSSASASSFFIRCESPDLLTGGSKQAHRAVRDKSGFSIRMAAACCKTSGSVSSAPCSCKKRIARVVWALARAVLPRFAVSQLV